MRNRCSSKRWRNWSRAASLPLAARGCRETWATWELRYSREDDVGTSTRFASGGSDLGGGGDGSRAVLSTFGQLVDRRYLSREYDSAPGRNARDAPIRASG